MFFPPVTRYIQVTSTDIIRQRMHTYTYPRNIYNAGGGYYTLLSATVNGNQKISSLHNIYICRRCILKKKRNYFNATIKIQQTTNTSSYDGCRSKFSRNRAEFASVFARAFARTSDHKISRIIYCLFRQLFLRSDIALW